MKAFKELMSWIVPIAIGLLLALLIKQFAFQFVRVDGPSMQPNLQNNERVVCLKQAKIHRGSVVVFDANGVDPQVSVKTEYVKRVIGLPGETVKIENGKIYINNKELKGFSEEEILSAGLAAYDVALEDDEYFVMGDNCNNSEDSRVSNIGNIKRSQFVGKITGTIHKAKRQ